METSQIFMFYCLQFIYIKKKKNTEKIKDKNKIFKTKKKRLHHPQDEVKGSTSERERDRERERPPPFNIHHLYDRNPLIIAETVFDFLKTCFLIIFY